MFRNKPSINDIFPLVPIVRNYSFDKFKPDMIAATTVALFTIPQAMAYAVSAGFPPSAGIMTAIAASILGAAFGSSEFLINGPTNAISAMIAANAVLFATRGNPLQTIITLTIVIGVLQVLASFIKMGSFTRFVSEPVLTGFTAGAGLYIAMNQAPSILGIEKIDIVKTIYGWQPPGSCLFDFIRTMLSIGKSNWIAITLGLATFFFVRLSLMLEKYVKQRLPGPFLAICLSTIISWLFNLGNESQGALKLNLVRDIEPLSRHIPDIIHPIWDIDLILSLLSPAMAIGVLGAVEAIAIGKALANKVGHHFDANKQLLGEGLCNVGAGLVGGFASSGSFSRSAVNFDSGAVTRMSCIFSGALILVIVYIFAPAANEIPLVALAGTLIHIGLKLVNIARMKVFIKTTISDRIVLLATFSSVLLARHLEGALFLGIIISIIEALRRAEGFKLFIIEEDQNGHLIEYPFESQKASLITTIDIQGEMFFATAEVFEHKLKKIIDGGTRILILRLQQAYNLDGTCVEAIENLSHYIHQKNGKILLTGIRSGMLGTLKRASLIEKIGEDCVFISEPTMLGSTHKALSYAKDLVKTLNLK